jgi:hypothetical protein
VFVLGRFVVVCRIHIAWDLLKAWRQAMLLI